MFFKTGFRKISLSFLMLANAILLAHAVIPHHHCDEMCIASTATAHHGHDCDLQSHKDIKFCSLTIIYAKFDNEKTVSQSYHSDFHLAPFIFALLPNYSLPQIENDAGLPFRQKPYLLSYLTEYTSQSIGLRAPPLPE